MSTLSRQACELISASALFESGRAPRDKMLEGLALLTALEPITRGSLPRASAPAPAEPAPRASAAPSASASVSPPPAISATTTRSEYRAALGDRTVVEALLALQRKVRTTQPAARPLSAFEPVQPQKVPADPRAFRYAGRSPGIYHPVLRAPHRTGRKP